MATKKTATATATKKRITENDVRRKAQRLPFGSTLYVPSSFRSAHTDISPYPLAPSRTTV